MVPPNSLANNLADVYHDQLVCDGLTVSAVVLVDRVGHHHPGQIISDWSDDRLPLDKLRTAEEVLGHLTHHSVGHEHVDTPGAPHPHQLGHGVEEGEAGVRQVVYQDHLQHSNL